MTDNLFGEQESENIELKATRIFFENLNSDKEINLNVGGGASSKSYSICQVLTYKFLTEDNKKILVARKTMPSLRVSVLWLFYKILDEFGVRARVKEDKVGMNLFYKNNVIHFNGLDDVEKVKSSDWNYMWFEEATEITKEDFNTVRLYLRAATADGNANRIFLSLNPIDEFHWVKEYLLDNPEMLKDIKFIHSTYKDNPFIDERTKQRYEDLINQDVNFYRIYTMGEWGKLDNLIYRNWEEVDSIPMNEKYMILYGIDFGFNDPTVIIKLYINGRDCYVEEILYKSNLTNSQLIEFMQNNIPKPEWSKPFYCDAAEPQRIKEIRLAGFNVKAAQKNVNDGIDLVKRMRLLVTRESPNVKKELKAYSWKTDRNGHVIDKPVEFLDHSMDAIRYPIYSQLRGEGIYKVRWLGK